MERKGTGSGLKRIAPRMGGNKPMGENKPINFGQEGLDRQNLPKNSGPFTEFDGIYITPVDVLSTPDFLRSFNSETRTKRK